MRKHITVLALTFFTTSTFAQNPQRIGLTWAKISHNNSFNTDLVGTTEGNPYDGDTACATALPILCIRKDGTPNPGVPTDEFTAWANGTIALSTPVVGNTLSSASDGDAVCVSSAGLGYQMAEFHDGDGWNFQAVGNVSDASRFWVHINDQDANCWSQELPPEEDEPTPVPPAPDRPALTWSKIRHDSTLKTDLVGTTEGNPYDGDTACTTALPILCIRKDGTPNPGVPTDEFTAWANGTIALSTPIVGNTLSSASDGDAVCASSAGLGYQMAEFHDGDGWNFQAVGNVSDASRFWVHINDQDANCWSPQWDLKSKSKSVK